MRFAGTCSLVVAMICLIGATYEFFFIPPTAPPPPFHITRTEFAADNVPPGTTPFRTTLTNPSKEPRRILGMAVQCVGNCCFKTVQDAPVLVSPGGSFDLDLELDVSRPGPIDAEIKIYLEENGIRTVTLRVTGTAVEAPRAPK